MSLPSPACRPTNTPLMTASHCDIHKYISQTTYLRKSRKGRNVPNIPNVLNVLNQLSNPPIPVSTLSLSSLWSKSVPFPFFIPSKYIPYYPHDAAPILDAALTFSSTPSQQPSPFPPVTNQPFIHIFNDDLFIRYHQRCYDDHQSTHLQLAVITRDDPEPTLRLATLDTTDSQIPIIILHLVARSILSLHWISEKTCIQFVLHSQHIPNSIVPSMVTFLSWLRNFAGVNVVHPTAAYSRDWIYNIIRRSPKHQQNEQGYTRYMSYVQNMDELHVKLRPYQQRAVAWMLSRESGDPVHLYDDDSTAWNQTQLLTSHCPLLGEAYSNNINLVQKLHFHAASCQIWFGEQSDSIRLETRVGHGGLLCDEMGLGKTVELMQLVLCNRNQLLSSSTDHNPLRNNNSFSDICSVCRKKSGSCSPLSSCVECQLPIHSHCVNHTHKIPSTSRSGQLLLCQHCSKYLTELSHETTRPEDLPQSRATLVIVPTALLLQWKTELNKHVKKALNIVIFQGLKRSGYVPLQTLLNADVVLSTYDALRADVANVESLRRPRAEMRYQRQYFPTPVPLLTLHWHRLALDEAQMLGTSSVQTTAALRMARFLHARYRWCVTGTPIAYDDLSTSTAMMSLLTDTNGEEIAWSKLCAPTQYTEARHWVAKMLRTVMWRTTKIDVEQQNELNLPEQITQVVRTKFGPVERFHYRSLQRDIAGVVSSLVLDGGRNLGGKEASISRDLLTSLRQACCHPRIGTSGRRLISSVSRQHRRRQGLMTDERGNPIDSSNKDGEADDKHECMDMESVLASLISKSKLQLQENLRACTACMNGLAGVGLMHYEIAPRRTDKIKGLTCSVECYRKGLQTASDLKHLVDIDKIQRMHIYFNLHVALELVDEERKNNDKRESSNEVKILLNNVGRAVIDDNLEEEFETLRSTYLRDAELALTVSMNDHLELEKELGEEPLCDKIPGEEDDDEDDEDMDEDYDEFTNDDDFEDPFPSTPPQTDENFDTAVDSDKSMEKGNNMNETNETGPVGITHNGTEAPVALEDTDSSANMFKRHRKKQRKTTWWELAMTCIIEAEEEEEFMERIETVKLERSQSSCSIVRVFPRIQNFLSIAVVIHNELNELQKERVKLNELVKTLPGAREPTAEEIAASGVCRNCRDGGLGSNCEQCNADEVIRGIEHKLYAIEDNDFDDDLFNTQANGKKTGRNRRRQRRLQTVEELTGENNVTDDAPGALSKRLVHDTWKLERKKQGDGLRLQGDLERLLIMLGTTRKSLQAVGKEDVKTRQKRKELENRMKSMFKKWMDTLEKVKKEVNLAKHALDKQRMLLGCMDEVNMAKTRLTPLAPRQKVCELSNAQKRHLIPRGQVNSLEKSLQAERSLVTRELRENRGRLCYLISLQKEMEEKHKAENENPKNDGDFDLQSEEENRKRNHQNMVGICAVCYIEYDDAGAIGILRCGHLFCKSCVKALVKRNKGRGFPLTISIQCPTCRQKTMKADILYSTVAPHNSTKPDQKRPRLSDGSSVGSPTKQTEPNNKDPSNCSDEDEIQPVNTGVDRDVSAINTSELNQKEERKKEEKSSTFIDREAIVFGSVGAKVSAIIRLLKGIWSRDKESKIVIFSEWIEVLKLLKRAFTLNEINVKDGSDVSNSNTFGNLINSFRNSSEGTVLLLPSRRAGAGLNLTEAQHVILVEPWLDVGQEKQAVGRVHRIGQTKVTYVHRVVVEGTIEDRILEQAEKCRSSTGNGAMVRLEDILDDFNELVTQDVRESTNTNNFVVDLFESNENEEGDDENR